MTLTKQQKEERRFLWKAYETAPHLFAGPPLYALGSGFYGYPVVHARDADRTTKLTQDSFEAAWAELQREHELPGFVQVFTPVEEHEINGEKWYVYQREVTPQTFSTVAEKLLQQNSREMYHKGMEVADAAGNASDDFDDETMTQEDLAKMSIKAAAAPMRAVAPAIQDSIEWAFKHLGIFIDDVYFPKNWGIRASGEVVCFDAQANDMTNP